MRGHFLRAASRSRPTLAGTGGAIPQSSILGQPYDGGFFAGYISHTANGNPTHALIVAPRATGATGLGYALVTNLAWKTAATTTAGGISEFDGKANTAAMVAAGIAAHPAAGFCVGLSVGGFADWYLPAPFELDIAYFNLKPGTANNSTAWGINNYSVPRRTVNNTTTNPAQTSIAAFNTSTEGFAIGRHWSSSENSAGFAFVVNFDLGNHVTIGKTIAERVRAFRRVTL
jgi:hypothetical protein